MDSFKIWTTEQAVMEEWRKRLEKAGFKRTNGPTKEDFVESGLEPIGILVEEDKSYFEYHDTPEGVKRTFVEWCAFVPFYSRTKAIKTIKAWR